MWNAQPWQFNFSAQDEQGRRFHLGHRGTYAEALSMAHEWLSRYPVTFVYGEAEEPLITLRKETK